MSLPTAIPSRVWALVGGLLQYDKRADKNAHTICVDKITVLYIANCKLCFYIHTIHFFISVKLQAGTAGRYCNAPPSISKMLCCYSLEHRAFGTNRCIYDVITCCTLIVAVSIYWEFVNNVIKINWIKSIINLNTWYNSITVVFWIHNDKLYSLYSSPNII